MRLHHLALCTEDVAGVAAFYRDLLGLSLVRDALPRAIWLGLTDGAVVMIERREPNEAAVAPHTRELVAFEVDETQKAALRIRLVREGRLEGETAHTLYFRDPDGRRVGVSTYPLARPSQRTT